MRDDDDEAVLRTVPGRLLECQEEIELDPVDGVP